MSARLSAVLSVLIFSQLLLVTYVRLDQDQTLFVQHQSAALFAWDRILANNDAFASDTSALTIVASNAYASAMKDDVASGVDRQNAAFVVVLQDAEFDSG